MLATTVGQGPTSGAARQGAASLLDQLTQGVDSPEERPATYGALRTLTGPVLGSISTMRHEAIEPYESALRYASLRLSADLEDDGSPVIWDERYLLGRAEALLEICHMGIDRSISTAVVRQAEKRKYVPEILRRLVADGETNFSELLDAIGIRTKQQLTNTLAWMEDRDLVRRVAVGRNTLVSLGPKGDAVYHALTEKDDDWRSLAMDYAVKSALAHQRGDLNTAADLAREGIDVLARSSGAAEIEIELLYRLAEIEHDIRHLRTAWECIGRAIALREADVVANGDPVRAGSRVPTAQLYRSRATISVVWGHWQDADEDFDKSLELATDDVPAVRARVFNSMAWSFIRREDFDRAERCCDQSRRLWWLAESQEPASEGRNLAYSYSHLAAIKITQKRSHTGLDPDETGEGPQAVLGKVAEIDSHIAAAVLGFNGDDRNESEAKLVLAGFRSRYGSRHREALQIAGAALRYGEDHDLDLPQARAHRVLAGIHLNAFLDDFSSGSRDAAKLEERLEQCERHLIASQRHARELEDPFELALTWRLSGVLLRTRATLADDREARERAEDYLRRADDAFTELGLPNEVDKTSKIVQWYRIDAFVAEIREPAFV